MPFHLVKDTYTFRTFSTRVGTQTSGKRTCGTLDLGRLCLKMPRSNSPKGKELLYKGRNLLVPLQRSTSLVHCSLVVFCYCCVSFDRTHTYTNDGETNVGRNSLNGALVWSLEVTGVSLRFWFEQVILRNKTFKLDSLCLLIRSNTDSALLTLRSYF